MKKPHALPEHQKRFLLRTVGFRIHETVGWLAYGGVDFSSKVGQLAGNHFIAITSDLDKHAELGKMTLSQGAQNIGFQMA